MNVVCLFVYLFTFSPATKGHHFHEIRDLDQFWSNLNHVPTHPESFFQNIYFQGRSLYGPVLRFSPFSATGTHLLYIYHQSFSMCFSSFHIFLKFYKISDQAVRQAKLG